MLKKDKEVASEKIFSIGFANLIALLVMVLMAVLSVWIIIGWEIDWSKEYIIKNIINLKSVVVLVLIFVSILVHEYIHAIVLKIFLKENKESVKIGFQKETFTPYCHCAEKLRLWQYAIAIIAPSIVLGFVPYIVALIYQDIIWLFFAWFNISAAGGDILIFLAILKFGNFNLWIKDHPTKVGFIVCKIDEVVGGYNNEET